MSRSMKQQPRALAGTPRAPLRSPSFHHVHGMHLMGKSASLPALPWWSGKLEQPTQQQLMLASGSFARSPSMLLPYPTKPRQSLHVSRQQTPMPTSIRDHDLPRRVPATHARQSSPHFIDGAGARPLTPSMQRELAHIVFDPHPRATVAAKEAEQAARLRAQRRAKYAPGPKVLRISGIACEDLPDADKGMGGGTSDPFLTFELVTDLGHREQAQTRTLMNAPRDVRFPDALEMPLPTELLRGKCNGTLIVRVWDDDSVEDGQEGVNANDLMGQSMYKLNCRLCPWRLEGCVDRATYAGVGNLYAFRVSFKYEAVPIKHEAEAELNFDDLNPLVLPNL